MHLEVLPPGGDAVLSSLTESGFLDGFYLAGGTALALQLGHRRSVDLDWFTPEPFDPGRLLADLRGLGELTVIQEVPGTLHLVLWDVRVSFFHYPHPLVEPLVETDLCRLAGCVDIGLMKITAISNRGSKKDFYDLYQIALRVMPLQDLFRRLPEKYPRIRYSTYHLLRSLAYFDDADQEPEPMLIEPLAWDEVKEFFRRAQREMMRRYEPK